MVEQLQKVPTGISGLDELTRGGLPAGRPTLVCGGPGCGKTLLATTFLVRGAIDHGEPGLLVSFDERIDDLGVNVASLGFDLPSLKERGLLATDYVKIERQEMHETGEYDLEALFIRLDYAVKSARIDHRAGPHPPRWSAVMRTGASRPGMSAVVMTASDSATWWAISCCSRSCWSSESATA